jgi:hypothetical protein
VLEPLNASVALYAIGVLVGLVRGDAGPAARVGLALLWPIGAVAFVVTVAGLLLLLAVIKPLIGVTAIVLAVLYGLLV